VLLMSEVTGVLSAIQQGDPHAAEQLLPLFYQELRQRVAQKLAHGMRSTRPTTGTGLTAATSFAQPSRPCGAC
jgi:hypothetical protein